MEIVNFNPKHITNFIYFIDNNKDDLNFFHPHEMDSITLGRILYEKKEDQYKIIIDNEKIIGYGLLRGWDEGYEIPSLGIMIDKDFRGLGLSKMFMLFLESTAKLKGSKKMRLVVYNDNNIAIKTYEKLGYSLEYHNENQLIGIKNL